MKAAKVLNYITGVLALVHAGTTSFFSKQIFQLEPANIDFTSYEQMMNYANSLPTSYFIATSLMLLTGLILFIMGIVTTIFNFRLEPTVRIKRVAVWTSLATILGVLIGLTPVANTIHAVFLSVLYIISGYFIPTTKS